MNWWLMGFMACLAVINFSASWLGSMYGAKEAMRSDAGDSDDKQKSKAQHAKKQ
jgi:hypothetical protein